MDENLEMDFFGSDDLELNIGGDISPSAETVDDDSGDNIDGQDIDTTTNNEINRSEDDSDLDDQDDSESVADGDDDQGEGDDNDSPNLFSSVASVLYDEGILPSLDINSLDINNADGLAKAVSNEVDNLVKSKIVEKLGESGYEYVTKGVTVEDYNEYKTNSDTLDSITEDALANDIELSKRVVYQDFINKGLSDAKAMQFIERSLAAGEHTVIDDAKEALESLKAYNVSQLESKRDQALEAEKQAELDRIELETKVKNSVYGTKELFKGFPIQKNTQDKVYKSMTTIVGTSPQGVSENALMRTRREDPVGFDTKLYYLYEITKGFSDFSKINKGGRSSAIKDLERAARANINSGSTPSFVQDKDSYDSPLDGHVLNL
jgi:hypothetical protein